MKQRLVNAARTKDTLTANGAVTNSTSLNNCLDMFFLAGASRNISEEDLITLFERARSEDKAIAYKILFWARDCRGGAGEKRFFQLIGKHIQKSYLDDWDQLAIHIPEYGYWKDVFQIDSPNENVLNWMSIALDEEEDSLLAKWFPRKGPWFVAMHKYRNETPKVFRKKLVKLTNVVENKMCKNKWNEIEYKTVPSIALNMYRTAFFKHDQTRFTAFNEKVIAGEEKANASVLFPHSLYQSFRRGDNEKAIQAQWQSLPNFMEGSTEKLLPVCDVSGSMTGVPMDVSVSLGCYISERNESIFKDAFITFSSKPTMEYLKGNIISRFQQLHMASWGMNTNLQAVFSLILKSAMDHKLKQVDMPTKILIISDMEFDRCATNTNLEGITSTYENAGYKLPGIIFWNVNGRIGNVPAQAKTKNVGLVSGFSPSILTSILGGKSFTPLSIMMDTISKERYKNISVD